MGTTGVVGSSSSEPPGDFFPGGGRAWLGVCGSGGRPGGEEC